MAHRIFAITLGLSVGAISLLGHAGESLPSTKVVILGTYHMGSPAQDVHNSTVDDVLADKRQREIAAVVAQLATFKPTIVAVESTAGGASDLSVPKYRDYLDGKMDKSRNEVVQIGFRLAREAGLKNVYGIDVDGDIPMEQLQAFAQKNGQGEILGAAMAPVQQEMQSFDALLKKATVADALRHMNEPGFVAAGNAFYRQTLRVGSGTEQPGAALVNAWQDRNTEICARLMQVTKPGDRAVVVFGAGHSYLLRQCVQEMPGYELVEANSLIK